MQTETDVQVLKSVVNKLDQTLDKIAESTNNIGRLLAVHDERIGNLEKDTEDAHDDIKDLYKKMEHNTKDILKEMGNVETRIESKLDTASKQTTTQYKSLSTKVDALDSRLNELEKYRWYIGGIIAVVLFVGYNLDTVSKVISVIK